MEFEKASPLMFYFCGQEKCVSSHSFGPAIRPHYLIHYILEGKGIYYENGREHKLGKGDGFLITPGTTTYYIADKESPWEYCWIGFDGYEATTILKNCGLENSEVIFHVNDPEMRDVLLELNDSFNNKLGNHYSYLSYLYKVFSYMRKTEKVSTDLDIQRYLEEAISYINNNYIYDLKITDVSKHIGIDRTYLYKLFIEGKKISPQEYLIEYRLQAACKYLRETKMMVTEISYSCGFKDSSSFNKHFKKRYSMTPLEYRKLIGRKNQEPMSKRE